MIAPPPRTAVPVPTRPLMLMLAAMLLLATLPQIWRSHELASPAVPVTSAPVVAPDFGKLPVLFVANQGQIDQRVAYYVQGSNKTLYFTDEGITIALDKPQPTPTNRQEWLSTLGSEGSTEPIIGPNTPSRWVVKLDFVGARPGTQPVGQGPSETIISQFKGQVDEWRTGIPTFTRLVYSDLWPGIDLVYSGTVDRLKYEFIVKPGADPSQIRLAYRGASNVQVSPAGQLEVSTSLGSFSDDMPVSYQEETNGSRMAVTTSYALATPAADGSVSYGFALGQYDSQLPLIIDPAMLIYAGYIGGSGDDAGTGIAVDSAGNAYVVGLTTDTSESSFPVISGPDLSFNGSTYDAFVAKVNASGTGLVYAGYIGGDGSDYGLGIAVDNAGNTYVVGSTWSTEGSFPVKGGPDLSYNGGGMDAFVAKVNASGTSLVYAGYVGGSNSDYGGDIAVDSAGNASIAVLRRS